MRSPHGHRMPCLHTTARAIETNNLDLLLPNPCLSSGCVDASAMCPRWAAAGECDKNVAFMRSNCPVSCGRCNAGLAHPRAGGRLDYYDDEVDYDDDDDPDTYEDPDPAEAARSSKATHTHVRILPTNSGRLFTSRRPLSPSRSPLTLSGRVRGRCLGRQLRSLGGGGRVHAQSLLHAQALQTHLRSVLTRQIFCATSGAGPVRSHSGIGRPKRRSGRGTAPRGQSQRVLVLCLCCEQVAALPRGKLTSEKGGAAAQAARRRLQAEASGRTGGGTAAAAQSSGLGCDDKDQRCPMWARADECNRNPEFMHKRCARSCNMCRVRLSASRRADSEL